MQIKTENGNLLIALEGTVNAADAPELEVKIQDACEANPGLPIVLDCDRLEYCTSAGLRMILRLKQEHEETSIINAHPDFYSTLDMTGFTDLMEVQKACRILPVEGCERIGGGANGEVYRFDSETVVKVYRNPDALPEIERERELARAAFVAGIPTAIPYDVVRILGGGYGSVFELLNAESYAMVLIRGEKTVAEVAAMSIELLKLIHSKESDAPIVPDMKETARDWARFLTDYLPVEQSEKLSALIEDIPQDLHLIHGDFHIKNILLHNGESLLIDMDTLSRGHPVFELAGMYNAYQGYSTLNHAQVKHFLGISYETATAFWKKSLELYLGTEDPKSVLAAEDRAKILGTARLLRRFIRHDGFSTEEGRAEIECCRNELAELLMRVDTLRL